VFAPIFAAFALVLVTACANVSNVMLSRAIARHRRSPCACRSARAARASSARC
jgi:hypothetical protein